MQFINLSSQQQRIKTEIDANIQKVLAHGQYILGAEVGELEQKLTEFCGAKYCITCANGTDALQIALMALGVKQGDEVITPAFTPPYWVQNLFLWILTKKLTISTPI